MVPPRLLVPLCLLLLAPGHAGCGFGRGRQRGAEAAGSRRARLEGLAPGGAPGGLALAGVDTRWERGRLLVGVAPRGGQAAASPERLGLPRDFRRISRLGAVVENGPAPATVELAVVVGGTRLVARRDLGAGHVATLELELADLPLAGRPGAPFAVDAVQIAVPGPAEGARLLRVRSLAAEFAAAPLVAPRIDAFGQRAGGGPAGKVRDVAELAASIEDEGRALRGMAPPPERNAFGGWTQGEGWQETGYFSVERDGGGRAWLVDPQGRPFFSVGLAGVRASADVTPVLGREFLFAELPARGSPTFRDAFFADEEGEGVSFYRWNVLRKWGSIARWRDRTLERLERWGFNTVGAGSSDPDIVEQRRVPHVRSFRSRGAAGVAESPGGFPDVFDPRWGAHLAARVVTAADRQRENPWLLGFALDDELRWHEMRLLDAPAGTPLRARWRAFLEARHASIAGLEAAWGGRVGSWEAARDLRTAALPRGGAADLRAFEALWIEAYLGAARRALADAAPNHLFIGPRLPPRPPGEGGAGLAAAIGRHVDLLCVEIDPRAFERAGVDLWHAGAPERPVLLVARGAALAEPHATLVADGALPAPARRAAFARALAAAAGLPYVVGLHWRKYVDRPPGAPGDGGAAIGFVDITDRPRDDLVAAAREATGRVYQLHAEAR